MYDWPSDVIDLQVVNRFWQGVLLLLHSDIVIIYVQWSWQYGALECLNKKCLIVAVVFPLLFLTVLSAFTSYCNALDNWVFQWHESYADFSEFNCLSGCKNFGCCNAVDCKTWHTNLCMLHMPVSWAGSRLALNIHYFCISEWNSMTKLLFKNCNVNPDKTPEMRGDMQFHIIVSLFPAFFCWSQQQVAIQMATKNCLMGEQQQWNEIISWQPEIIFTNLTQEWKLST